MPFKAFLDIVDRLIDKHCPKRRTAKTKRQTKSKLWIIPDLSNSKKTKNRVCKQFYKASDSMKIKDLHEWFKNCRNLKTILTRVCKEGYYKSFFQVNRKDSKKYIGRYKVNCECRKQKINTKHKFKYR